MKTLLLVRHAKSSWADPGQEDIDRPLNDRGKKDAPEMARRVRAKLPDLDLLVSSTARRTQKTARHFTEAYGLDKDDIQLNADLYLAPASTIYQIVAGLPEKAATVALFGHNPGITEFANMLANVRIDNMPTCSVFAVSADADSWAEFVSAPKQFLFFDYPKNPLEA